MVRECQNLSERAGQKAPEVPQLRISKWLLRLCLSAVRVLKIVSQTLACQPTSFYEVFSLYLLVMKNCVWNRCGLQINMSGLKRIGNTLLAEWVISGFCSGDRYFFFFSTLNMEENMMKPNEMERCAFHSSVDWGSQYQLSSLIRVNQLNH